MSLLILGGTGEGQKIAEILAAQGADAVVSLAGGSRIEQRTGLPTRVGGFGGSDGFRRYLREAGIHAVLDATHPFADSISRRTAAICHELNLPYCLLLRPAWHPGPGDDWAFLDHEEDAAEHVPPGAVVFMTTGRQNLERFANLAGRRLYCRRIGLPQNPFPFEGGEYLTGTPPFSVQEERELFQRLGVNWLIVKNAGGEAPRTKLIAARQLGIPVALINRPAPPDALRVKTVDEALTWIAAQ